MKQVLEDSEKRTVAGGLGKTRIQSITKPNPPPHPWWECDTPEMGIRVQTRELLEIPSFDSSINKGNYDLKHGNILVFLSSFFFASSFSFPFPLLSLLSFLPFLLFCAPAPSDLMVVTASIYRSQNYEGGEPASAFSGTVISKAWDHPLLPFLSLSSLWLANVGQVMKCMTKWNVWSETDKWSQGIRKYQGNHREEGVWQSNSIKFSFFKINSWAHSQSVHVCIGS